MQEHYCFVKFYECRKFSQSVGQSLNFPDAREKRELKIDWESKGMRLGLRVYFPGIPNLDKEGLMNRCPTLSLKRKKE